MGQGLMAYLIADPRDVEVYGSRRRKLLGQVLSVLADDLADYDEQAEVEAEGYIPHSQALKEIFAGKLTRPDDCGPIYGGAYELYCSSMGEWLSNRAFCPCTVAWFKMLDKKLKQHRVPLQFQTLLFERFPIPVETDASPCGGVWEHDAIVAAGPPLTEAITAATEDNVGKALEELADWVRRATAAPGSVIAGFFN